MSMNESWDQVDLPALLQLNSQGDGCFRSRFCDLNLQGRVYGGQLLGQAASAAAAYVDGRMPTYLHGLFLKGAVAGHPIEYRVERLQEGKRFSSFQVRGTQLDRPVIDAHVSFQVEEEGIEHGERLQTAVPQPLECPTMGMLEKTYAQILTEANYRLMEKNTLEARFINPEDFLFKPADLPKVAYWVRPRRQIADGLQRCLATIYLSDYFFGFCIMAPHRPMVGARDEIYVASLNHSIWLHGQPRADEWLLFMNESPHAKSGRGLAYGKVYGEDGRLVASVTQEMSVVGKAP